MSWTEDRIREALTERAGSPPVTTMPPSVQRRVRVRQAGLAAALGSVAVLGIAVAVIAYGTALTPRPDSASTFDPAADGYTSPLEDVPPHWPAVDIHDPASAYVPSLAGDSDVHEGPVVLASGRVEGASFTLYAYTLGHGADATPCLGFVGFAPAGAPTKSSPDMGTCANAPAVPQRQDVAFIGGGNAEVPGLEGNFGFVSERVDVIYVWGGGRLGGFAIPRLPRLDGWKVSPFFFVPAPDAGPLEVSATRSNGGVVPLAHADICGPSEVSGTCRTKVYQDLPISSPVDVPLPIPAGAWPSVTYGGEFEPYVDHEANADGVRDPGVVGEKTVIAYGTVQKAPWSLVAYNTRYPGAPGDVSPAGDFFITGVGGSGATLFNTTPWAPNDFAAGRMHGDDARFDSVDGIVSTRVHAVRLELSDGTVQDVTLIPGPAGVDARYFVLFIPHRAQGRLVALDAAGREVEQMCLRDMMGVPPGGDPCAR